MWPNGKWRSVFDCEAICDESGTVVTGTGMSGGWRMSWVKASASQGGAEQYITNSLVSYCVCERDACVCCELSVCVKRLHDQSLLIQTAANRYQTLFVFMCVLCMLELCMCICMCVLCVLCVSGARSVGWTGGGSPL